MVASHHKMDAWPTTNQQHTVDKTVHGVECRGRDERHVQCGVSWLLGSGLWEAENNVSF